MPQQQIQFDESYPKDQLTSPHPHDYSSDLLNQKISIAKQPGSNQRLVVAIVSLTLWMLLFVAGLVIFVIAGEAPFSPYPNLNINLVQPFLIVGILAFTLLTALINFFFYLSRKQ